jgi:hypothetical protein
MFEHHNKAFVTGTFTDAPGKLTIEAEINGFNPIQFIASLIGVCMIVFFVSFLSQPGVDKSPLSLPLVLFFGLVIIVSPYMVMRRNVSRMKYEIERELVYLAKETE